MSGEATTAAPAAVEEKANWLALIVVILGAFMAILDNSLVNVALPQLANLFGATTDQIEWVVTGYSLASGVVVPLTGFIGDRFGYKKSFILAVAIFGVASLLCALAWNTNSIVGFRILQGLGGGTLMPLSMAIVYQVIPRRQMGLALGIWGISAMAAPAIGPTLGGYLIEYFSWRLLFLINVPISIVSVLLAWIILRETPTNRDLTFDLPGFLLSTVGLGALLLALSEGQKEGWTSFYIVSLLFVATSCLVTLVWVELGKEKPLLDLTLFRNPTFTISTITSSLVMIGLYAGIFLIPFYLEDIQGLSAMDTGLLLMPQALAMGLTMPIAGRLFDKIGPVPLGLVGVTIVALMTLELHHLSLDTPYPWLRIVLTVRGIGIGLSMMPLTTAGMNALRPDQVGRASGLSNMVRQVAAAFGIAILTTILQQRTAVQMSRITDSIPMDSGAFAQLQATVGAALTQAGVDAGTVQGGALAVLVGLIQREATTQAIADTFLVAAIPLFAALPLIVLLRARGAARAKSASSPSSAPVEAGG